MFHLVNCPTKKQQHFPFWGACLRVLHFCWASNREKKERQTISHWEKRWICCTLSGFHASLWCTFFGRLRLDNELSAMWLLFLDWGGIMLHHHKIIYEWCTGCTYRIIVHVCGVNTKHLFAAHWLISVCADSTVLNDQYCKSPFGCIFCLLFFATFSKSGWNSNIWSRSEKPTHEHRYGKQKHLFLNWHEEVWFLNFQLPRNARLWTIGSWWTRDLDLFFQNLTS